MAQHAHGVGLAETSRVSSSTKSQLSGVSCDRFDLGIGNLTHPACEGGRTSGTAAVSAVDPADVRVLGAYLVKLIR